VADVLEGVRPPPNRYLGAQDHRYATYGSYMAEAACEGLELGLIACLSPQRGLPCASSLAAGNHIGDSPGPFSGAGVQWTAYAINHLGYYWALVAALFAQVPSAQPWCANQPLKLLHALRPAPSIERALLALWVMHALPDEPRYAGTDETAVQAVRDVGGLAGTWIARPNSTGPDPEFAEEEEWTAVAPHDASALTPASNDSDGWYGTAVPTRAIRLTSRSRHSWRIRPCDRRTVRSLPPCWRALMKVLRPGSALGHRPAQQPDSAKRNASP
jgi:hypothetical protein